MNTATTNHASILATAGRVLLATIFIFSGLGKIAAPAATIGYIASAGLPLVMLAFALADHTQLGGGLLLVPGVTTCGVVSALARFAVVVGLASSNAIDDLH